jgi:multimeric flavodoxin WrbA
MKIVVLSGSPKGMTSVTVHYVLFLAKRYPEHELGIIHVCQDLRRLEEDRGAFDEVIRAIAGADGVIWAFPLYYLLVHAHYKRFIELVFERGARDAFQGKYAAALSTSIHFFDHTAHNYIHAVCDDLGMRFFGSYSAAMYDLREETERERLALFARRFFEAIQKEAPTPRTYGPIEPLRFTYAPTPGTGAISTAGRKVIVVADETDAGTNLGRMIQRFRDGYADPVELIDLREVKIRGPCLGCLQCGQDNTCVYRDADEVFELYQRLTAADVLVFAGAIKDRYLSSRWKLFFDRGFFYNHVPIFGGKQIGLLISGPLMQVASLRQLLEGYVEGQGANLAGIVTDECGNSRQLDGLLDTLARGLIACAETGYVGPPTFLGVAARKLFRDEIWSHMRVVFPADHRYYKRHGLYDFPKRSLGTRLREGLLTLMLQIPAFRREFRKRIKDAMVEPLAQVLEQVESSEAPQSRPP